MAEFILTGFADEIADSLDAQIEGLRKNGIGFVEIRGVGGRNISTYTPEEAHGLRKKLDAGGIRVSALGSPVGKIGLDDPAEWDRHFAMFKAMLDVANALGTRYLRMFSFFLPGGEPPLKYRDEVMSRLHALVEAASGRGVMLVHENERDIYGEDIARCLDILTTFEGGIRCVLDPANYVICGVDPKEAYPALKPYIEYLHVKDARGSLKREGEARDLGFQNVSESILPAGVGDGQIEWIVGQLWKDGFEGFLSVEPHLVNNSNYPGDGLAKFTVAADHLKMIINRIT